MTMQRNDRIRRPSAATAVVALAMGMGVAPASAVEIGVTSAVNDGAFGTPPAASQRTLFIGTELVFEEEIETDAQGQAQILFRDRSSLTVSPNARLVIDRFVYDPNDGTGELTVSFSQGLMRFVGGALSKQDDQVTVRTPSATIGIRGGGTLIDVDPATQETVVTFMLGEWADIRLPDGTQRRLTIPGTRQRIPVGGGGVDLPPVGRAGSEAIGRSLERLDGQSGRSAGATDVPTDDRVGDTEVVMLGSTLGPDGDPTVDGGLVDGEVVTAVTNDGPVPVPDSANDVVEGVQDEVDVEPKTELQGRLMTSSFEYQVTSGFVIPDRPTAEIGLLGGERDLLGTAVGTLSLSDDTVSFQDGAGALLTLPRPVDGGAFAGFDTGNAIFGTISGGSDILAGGALQYVFGRPDAFPDERFFFFFGEPTPNSGQIPTQRRLREYHVHSDPVQGGNLVPFSPPQFGFDRSGAAVSPFYILEPSSGLIGVEHSQEPGTQEPFTPYLQASLSIDGQGPDQRSLLIAAIGDVDRDFNPQILNIVQPYHSSYRIDSRASASVMSLGRTDSLPGVNASFYGDDLDAFILSYLEPTVDDQGVLDPFWSASRILDGVPFTTLPGSGEDASTHFGFVNPAELTGLVPDVSGVEGPGRTSRTLTGYGAGIAEAQIQGGILDAVPMFTDGDGFELTFDAAQNGLLVDVDLLALDPDGDVYALFLPFGDGLGSDADSFIDDDRYGATPSVITDATLSNLDTQISTSFPLSTGIVVPHTLVPDTDWVADTVTLCTCDYIEWGWWAATEFFFPLNEVQDGRKGNPYVSVHLATWAAGSVPDVAEIPLAGTATFEGHAIGNVLTGGHAYIAAGNYRQVHDFSTRMSDFTISDFDGMTVTGSLAASGGDPGFHPAHLESVSIVSPDLTIHPDLSGVEASFVAGGSDPVAGVVGQFVFSGTLPGQQSYLTAGTIAADRLPTGAL